MQEHALRDWLVLNSTPRLGRTRIQALVDEFGTPTAVLDAPSERLRKIQGIGRTPLELVSDPSYVAEARQRACFHIEHLHEQQITLLSISDENYPSRLRNIADPPQLLYLKGRVELLAQQGVAIVGSRSASSYGQRVAFKLAGELASRGVCVISGLAMGIDGAAHAGALEAEGATIGVLGCGIDVVYPRHNRDLFAAMEEKGLIVSEYPMGTRADGFRFPERNRIISGLSGGVVVVEATRKSGSLITAGLALDQGREVFAVPGRVDSIKSQGPHALIQAGAKLVQQCDDILDELDFFTQQTTGPDERKEENVPEGISEGEQHLLAYLDAYPVNIDELVRSSGYTAADVADMLLRLELKGLVRQLPGQQYERIEN